MLFAVTWSVITCLCELLFTCLMLSVVSFFLSLSFFFCLICNYCLFCNCFFSEVLLSFYQICNSPCLNSLHCITHTQDIIPVVRQTCSDWTRCMNRGMILMHDGGLTVVHAGRSDHVACWEIWPGCMQGCVSLLHDGWSCPYQVHAGSRDLSRSGLSVDYTGSVSWQHF